MLLVIVVMKIAVGLFVTIAADDMRITASGRAAVIMMMMMMMFRRR